MEDAADTADTVMGALDRKVPDRTAGSNTISFPHKTYNSSGISAGDGNKGGFSAISHHGAVRDGSIAIA